MALFALCFKLIALCRAVAAVTGGGGEREARMDSQRERSSKQGEKGKEAITAVITYVFRSQLHSSGNKYGSMRNTNTTLIKGFKMQRCRGRAIAFHCLH